MPNTECDNTAYALIFRQSNCQGKKRHLEWNCNVSERWRIIGMGGRIFRIDDGELEPSKNGRF